MEIRIRRARPGDASALTALMHDLSAYRGEYAGILAGYAVSAEQIARDNVYVAEGPGALLGFHSLVLGDEPELDLLFVSDSAQGRGVGALLFRHMLGTAQGLGITRIRIVSHPPAEAFYLRMGARRIGTRPASGRVSWPRPILEIEVPCPVATADPR